MNKFELNSFLSEVDDEIITETDPDLIKPEKWNFKKTIMAAAAFAAVAAAVFLCTFLIINKANSPEARMYKEIKKKMSTPAELVMFDCGIGVISSSNKIDLVGGINQTVSLPQLAGEEWSALYQLTDGQLVVIDCSKDEWKLLRLIAEYSKTKQAIILAYYDRMLFIDFTGKKATVEVVPAEIAPHDISMDTEWENVHIDKYKFQEMVGLFAFKQTDFDYFYDFYDVEVNALKLADDMTLEKLVELIQFGCNNGFFEVYDFSRIIDVEYKSDEFSCWYSENGNFDDKIRLDVSAEDVKYIVGVMNSFDWRYSPMPCISNYAFVIGDNEVRYDINSGIINDITVNNSLTADKYTFDRFKNILRTAMSAYRKPVDQGRELFDSLDDIRKALAKGELNIEFAELTVYNDDNASFFRQNMPLFIGDKSAIILDGKEIDFPRPNASRPDAVLSLRNMDRCFQIEKLMFLNDETIAVVTKLDRKGHIYYAYSFFKVTEKEIWDFGKSVSATKKLILPTHEWCIACPGRKGSDFIHLKAGDSIDKVLAVESSFVYDAFGENRFAMYRKDTVQKVYSQNYMLDDGIISFSYIEEEPGKYVLLNDMFFASYDELGYTGVALP